MSYLFSWFSSSKPALAADSDVFRNWIINGKKISLYTSGDVIKYHIINLSNNTIERSGALQLPNEVNTLSTADKVNYLINSEVALSLQGTPIFNQGHPSTVYRKFMDTTGGKHLYLLKNGNRLEWETYDPAVKTSSRVPADNDFNYQYHHHYLPPDEEARVLDDRLKQCREILRVANEGRNPFPNSTARAAMLEQIPAPHRLSVYSNLDVTSFNVSDSGQLESVCLKKSSESSCLDSTKIVDRDHWAVTLVSVSEDLNVLNYTDPFHCAGHAEVIVEGIESHWDVKQHAYVGKPFIYAAHLTQNNGVQICSTNPQYLNDHIKTKTQTWLLSSGDVKRMMDNIKMESRNPSSVSFHTAGYDSVFSKPVRSADGSLQIPHNCISWALSKLKNYLRIELPQSQLNGLITLPKSYATIDHLPISTAKPINYATVIGSQYPSPYDVPEQKNEGNNDIKLFPSSWERGLLNMSKEERDATKQRLISAGLLMQKITQNPTSPPHLSEQQLDDLVFRFKYSQDCYKESRNRAIEIRELLEQERREIELIRVHRKEEESSCVIS
jgi:hypothetical protein